MAKPNRAVYTPLPLSGSFYALLARVGKRHRLPVADDSALAQAVATLSHAYTRGRDLLAEEAVGETAELARLGFFLPRDLPKVFGPLEELWRTQAAHWSRALRVLDLGAGLGTTSLGIARYFRMLGAEVPRLEVHAVERDAGALALFRSVADELPALADEFVPIALHAHAGDMREHLPEGRFDLITCGLVLNEIASAASATGTDDAARSHAALLYSLIERLQPHGALIVIEPASKLSARALMATRDALLAAHPGLHIVAPCVHTAACPMRKSERDWCHEELPFALPARLASIATAAGIRYEGLSYAALVVTREGPTHAPAEGTRYRVVSDALPSKGKHELYGCAEHGYVRLGRLLRHETRANQPFGEARRGDVLSLPDAEARVLAETRVELAVGPRAATGRVSHGTQLPPRK